MLTQIGDFLEEHVTGKTLYTAELAYELDNGALEGVYADQISFSNLRRGSNSLQLDMFIVANEKIYLLSPQKERQELRRDFSGVSLFRFELAQRLSADQVTGLFRFISASGRDLPAEAVISSVFGFQLADQRLTWQEEQALYRDQPGPEGTHRAVAFVSEQRLFVEDGMLHYEYDGNCYNVDPRTMRRLDSSDRFPPFISVER